MGRRKETPIASSKHVDDDIVNKLKHVTKRHRRTRDTFPIYRSMFTRVIVFHVQIIALPQ